MMVMIRSDLTVFMAPLLATAPLLSPTKKRSLFSRGKQCAGGKQCTGSNHQNQPLINLPPPPPLKIVTYLTEIDSYNSSDKYSIT
jgi:hypothetical protein